MNKNLYLGVMSGTSLDGIDLALINVEGEHIQYLKGGFFPYDVKLRRLIEIVCHEANVALFQIGELQVKLSRAYADAINHFLKDSAIKPANIKAIGCHGQTVFHRPQGQFPFSMQLVDPSLLAAATGIATVSDFRSMDLALGGQGAPLIPAFHHALYGQANNDGPSALLNLGGMANLTLFHQGQVQGFDTGPANVLIDLWVQIHFGKPFDENGDLAAKGVVNQGLLAHCLNDEYFKQPAPKSTGREYFNWQWLEKKIQGTDLANEDVLATLTALTAKTVADALLDHDTSGELLLFGGGAHNNVLVTYLEHYLPDWTLSNSGDTGIPADYMEAAAFAWFAHLRMTATPMPLASVTGGQNSAICGVVALAPSY